MTDASDPIPLAGSIRAVIEQLLPLVREVYDSHRDPDTYVSDWEYIDPNNRARDKMEDRPCAWCDETKLLLDQLEALLHGC